jgi:hypothetical protein
MANTHGKVTEFHIQKIESNGNTDIKNTLSYMTTLGSASCQYMYITIHEF